MITIDIIERSEYKAISGTIAGERYTMDFTKERLATMLNFQAELERAADSGSYYKVIKDAKSFVDQANSEAGNIITKANSNLYYDTKTDKFYVKVGDTISVTPVPRALVNVILESVEKSIDPAPLVKAWIRFLHNVNFTPAKGEKFAEYITATIIDFDNVRRLVKKEGFSQEKAEARSVYNDVAITKEGLIVTKKYATLITKGYSVDPKTNKIVKGDLYKRTPKVVDPVTGKVSGDEIILPDYAEDLYFEPAMMGRRGDPFYCGKDSEKPDHIIKIGQEIFFKDWKFVDTNDDVCCVKGLHTGGWMYVQSYGGASEYLLDCFVDPADIGAVVGIGEGRDGAMRVRSYFVYGGNVGRTRGIYHSSTYAAMKDAEWEEYKKQAIEESNRALKHMGL